MSTETADRPVADLAGGVEERAAITATAPTVSEPEAPVAADAAVADPAPPQDPTPAPPPPRETRTRGLTLRLEEQLSDLRSDHVAYRLSVRNDGDTPLTLLSIEPRLPRNAYAVEATASSLMPTAGRHGAVLADLNSLLKMVLLPDKTPAARQLAFEKVLFRVASAADARAAHARWIAPLEATDLVRALFEEKLEQLAQLEAALGSEADAQGLLTIDPGDAFCATFVIGFRRNKLDPCKYQLSFAISHQRPGEGALVSTVANNVLISPNAVNLSLIAVLGAVAGALLALVVQNMDLPFAELVKKVRPAHLFAGPFIAVVVFNVYEYTSLAKGIRMGVSWRSALLIGALSGFAQERMLAALAAFAGVGAAP